MRLTISPQHTHSGGSRPRLGGGALAPSLLSSPPRPVFPPTTYYFPLWRSAPPLCEGVFVTCILIYTHIGYRAFLYWGQLAVDRRKVFWPLNLQFTRNPTQAWRDCRRGGGRSAQHRTFSRVGNSRNSFHFRFRPKRKIHFSPQRVKICILPFDKM